MSYGTPYYRLIPPIGHYSTAHPNPSIHPTLLHFPRRADLHCRRACQWFASECRSPSYVHSYLVLFPALVLIIPTNDARDCADSFSSSYSPHRCTQRLPSTSCDSLSPRNRCLCCHCVPGRYWYLILSLNQRDD
jgi:hypothetical protein